MEKDKFCFLSFEKLKEAVLRSKKELHWMVEERVRRIFRGLYPDAFVKLESNFVFKGRADMIVHLKDKSVHIELIASKEMVNRGVKLLVRSLCDVKIVILMDDEIDDKVAYQYHDELHSRNLSPDYFGILVEFWGQVEFWGHNTKLLRKEVSQKKKKTAKKEEEWS
ncbi:MAG: hypothetical protein AB1414_19875 [bacterium]